jgi:guanylate kinase
MSKTNCDEPFAYCNIEPSPLLVVLSGPSGVGKDAVLARMKDLKCPVEYIVTATTRARRTGEMENVDYQFVSTGQFLRMMEDKELLEWANVYGNMYGIPKASVRRGLTAGKDTLVKVDIQGAMTIRRIAPQALLIFLMPSSLEELCQRLEQRRTESAFDLALRKKTAEEEVKIIRLFDYVVVNRHGEVDKAVAQIMSIIAAEKCRVVRREVSIY